MLSPNPLTCFHFDVWPPFFGRTAGCAHDDRCTRITYSTHPQWFPSLIDLRNIGRSLFGQSAVLGPTPDTTITRQTVLVHTPPTTPAARQCSELFSAMVLQAVRDEDYPVGLGIQAGLGGGANETFLYERNAPAVQYYHHTVARLMAALAGEDLV